MSEAPQKNSSGIKSIGTAFKILEIVARNNGPITLKQIAERAGVSPSKAHRYVQSLCACELLNQAHKSGSYDIGVSALRIGLSAVNRIDVVNRAGDALPDLAESLRADVFITVWSELGPTVVRFERSHNPCVAMVGPGVAFPLFTSATGLVFLAYAAPGLLKDAVQRELDAHPELHKQRSAEIAAKYEHVKENGFVYTSHSVRSGRQCVAAPILSLDGRVIAAVSYVVSRAENAPPDQDQVRTLLEFCQRYSLSKSGFDETHVINQAIAV